MRWITKFVVSVLAIESTIATREPDREEDLFLHFTPDQTASLRAHSGFAFEKYKTDIALAATLPPGYSDLMPELSTFSSSQPHGLSTLDVKEICDSAKISVLDADNPDHIKKITPYVVARSPGEYWEGLSADDTQIAMFSLANSLETTNERNDHKRNTFKAVTTAIFRLKPLNFIGDYVFTEEKIGIDIVAHTRNFWQSEISWKIDETLLAEDAKQEVDRIRHSAHKDRITNLEKKYKEPVDIITDDVGTMPDTAKTMSHVDQQGTIKVVETTLSKVHNIMDDLLAAHATIDIELVEKNPKTKKLHQELRELEVRHINGEELSSEISEKSRALKSEIVKIHTEQKQFTKTIYEASRSLTGAVKLISLWDNDLARQIATVGGSTLQAVEQGAALLGKGLAAGAVNPVFAIGVIGEAIGNIVGLFKSRSSAPDPNVIILNSINKLFEQMVCLRQEIHAEFSALSTQNDLRFWQVLMEISDVKNYQQNILSFLHLIDMKVNYGFMNQDVKLTAISGMLSTILGNLGKTPYRDNLDHLKKHLRYIAENSRFPEYTSLSSDLNHLSLEVAISYQLESILHLPESESPAGYFQLYNHFSRLITEFQNNTLIQIKHEISPMSVIYACVAKLLLSYKVYPIHNSPYVSERITRHEIEQLRKYDFALGNVTQLIMSARDPKLLDNLIATYNSTAKALSEKIADETFVIESTYTSTLQSDRKALLLEQTAREWDSFNPEFEIGTHDWFTGTEFYDCRWHDSGARTWREDQHNNPYENAASKADFISDKKKAIRTAKQILTDQILEHQSSAKNSHLSTRRSNHSRISAYHGISFIKPAEHHLPYLPSPDPLLPADHKQADVMQQLQEAQALGVGSIEFFYSIDRENNIYQIEIKFHFHSDREGTNADTTDVIAKLKLPFEPLFYQGKEAVWYDWVGSIDPLKADFISEKTGTKEVRYTGPGPVITGSEAVRGGGRGHKNGEYQYTRYTIELPPPPTVKVGKLAHFKRSELISLDVNTIHLERLRQAVQRAYEKFLDHYVEKLHNNLSYAQSDKLGVACQNFEEAYRNLYGTLSYAYFDEMQDSSTPLSQWFARQSSNINRLKKALSEAHPQSLLTKLIDELPKLYEVVPLVRPNELKFRVLSETRSALQTFLSLYEPHAVKDNIHFPKINFDNDVKEALATISTVVINGMLRSLTPEESIKEVFSAIEKYDPLVKEEALKRVQRQSHTLGTSLPAPTETNRLTGGTLSEVTREEGLFARKSITFFKQAAKTTDADATEKASNSAPTIQPTLDKLTP